MSRKLSIGLLCGLFILLLFFYGCKEKIRDPNYISSYLKSMTSYVCDTEIIVKNTKGNYIYSISQAYLENKGSRLQLGNERIYLYIGEKIYVTDLNNKLSYTMNNSVDGIFKLSILKEYIDLLYTNENIKYEYKDISGQEYQVIELIIPGNNRDMSKAQLYVNTKNKYPYKLCIFNYKGEENVEVKYSNFKPNMEIDKALFDVNWFLGYN